MKTHIFFRKLKQLLAPKPYLNRKGWNEPRSSGSIFKQNFVIQLTLQLMII